MLQNTKLLTNLLVFYPQSEIKNALENASKATNIINKNPKKTIDVFFNGVDKSILNSLAINKNAFEFFNAFIAFGAYFTDLLYLYQCYISFFSMWTNEFHFDEHSFNKLWKVVSIIHNNVNNCK